MKEKLETAIFGAGCFWGVEETFRKIKGVKETAVGYMGGDKENPTYKQVCSGTTGHTEVTEVKFDPEKVSYGELLNVFWKIHDPTQVDKQGPDVGRQYRSVIFYHSSEQKRRAEELKEVEEKSGKYKRPIATTIEPAEIFWRAEEYHQRYVEKGGRTVC